MNEIHLFTTWFSHSWSKYKRRKISSVFLHGSLSNQVVSTESVSIWDQTPGVEKERGERDPFRFVLVLVKNCCSVFLR